MNQATDNSFHPRPADDGEIGLLDLLATIAENLKLLLLGSILSGLLAWGVTFWMTPTYESVSVLQAELLKAPSSSEMPAVVPAKSNPHVIARLAQSADVLQAVAKEMDIEPQASHTQRLKRMQARVSAAVGRQDNLVTLTARASTPERAQQLNQAVWARVYPLTLPAAMDRERTQAQLKSVRDGLATSAALEQSMAQRLQSGQITEASARLYAEVQNANTQRIRDIAALEAQLEGLGDASLVQRPTLPDVPTKPRKALIAAVAALAAGMGLLLFVFIRQALRSARSNPAQADSLRRLRTALGLKP